MDLRDLALISWTPRETPSRTLQVPFASVWPMIRASARAFGIDFYSVSLTRFVAVAFAATAGAAITVGLVAVQLLL